MSRTSFRVNLHSITWLNFKELLARSRSNIWSLSDSNGIRSYNHLVRKRTLHHLGKLVYWLWVQIPLLSLQFFILQFDDSFLRRCNILFCFIRLPFQSISNDHRTHVILFLCHSDTINKLITHHFAVPARYVHLKKCSFSPYLDCMLFQVAHNHVVYYQSFFRMLLPKLKPCSTNAWLWLKVRNSFWANESSWYLEICIVLS